MPSLEMKEIKKRFGATLALDGVSLQVSPGEVHGLVGQNGAGKSTLMKVLSGALRPDSGEMLLEGRPYAPASPNDGAAARRHDLSGTRPGPHLSIAENILLGMEPTRLGLVRWPETKRRARQALTALGHGSLDVTRPVAGLSPATQQVIEIARALAIGCRVLVLDEPTSSLTRKDVHALFDLIRRLKAQGRAIIYISHFLEEVRTICDRFSILRDGKTVATGDAPATPPEKMVEFMVGRTVDNLYPRSPRTATPGDPILELQNLSGPLKPTGASLTLRRGEVLGVAGLIIGGRTELLRSLFGLDKIQSGQIRIAAFSGQQIRLSHTSPPKCGTPASACFPKTAKPKASHSTSPSPTTSPSPISNPSDPSASSAPAPSATPPTAGPTPSPSSAATSFSPSATSPAATSKNAP